MIRYYDLIATEIDLSQAVKNHSGDLTVAYKTVDGRDICLCYYYPVDFDAKKQYPAFVFVHGGGWTEHKIFDDQNGRWQGDHLGFLARYYAQRGFVCVSMDYRLIINEGQQDENQLIHCYDDCAAAMDAIIDHAAEYSIDTGCVYLLGESAGGHLAGMLATAYQNKNFRFKTAFLVNAILDFTIDTFWSTYIPRYSSHRQLHSLSLEAWTAWFSPLCRIRKDNCPVVLLHGQRDSVVSLGHSEHFYQEMTTRSLPCELHIIRETNHAFLLAEFTDNQVACKIGVAIINSYLEEHQDQFLN